MESHPTITIEHDYSKTEISECYDSYKSPLQSPRKLVGTSTGTAGGTASRQQAHHSAGKSRQSTNKVPVRQRSVSPPASNQLLTASDSPSRARRNRRKSVCTVFVAPPSPTRKTNPAEFDDYTAILQLQQYADGRAVPDSNAPTNFQHSDYHTGEEFKPEHTHNHRKSFPDKLNSADGGQGKNVAPNSSNERRAAHRKHHRKSPKPSPNTSPRGSKNNVSAISNSLMDKIQQMNLSMRRQSSPAISDLSNVPYSSLRGSLALADALSSSSTIPPGLDSQVTSSRKMSSSQPSGYRNMGNEQHRGSRSSCDGSRGLSSPPSLEEGKHAILS